MALGAILEHGATKQAGEDDVFPAHGDEGKEVLPPSTKRQANIE